jgi:hypothetical protein
VSPKMSPFALIKTALRRDSVHESKTPLAPTPPSVLPRPLSKGPPPLPKSAAPPPLPLASDPAEQLFFQEGVDFFDEGIDGHAESVPPSGPHACALDVTNAVVSGEADTIQATPSTIAPTSLWLEPDEEVEDPMRTRRRRAARIGTAWGMLGALAVVGVAAFASPRRDVRSAAAPTSPATVETSVASPPVATSTAVAPLSQGPLSSAVATIATPPGAHVTTTSTPAAVPASLHGAARASSPSSPGARSASTSPRASGPRTTRGHHPQPIRSGPIARSSAQR